MVNGAAEAEIFKRYREITALKLIEMGAVRISPSKPFRLASGSLSPIYINCRRAISDPAFMQIFTSYSMLVCEKEAIDIDVIAGGETAGIPFAAYLACAKSMPMVYIRKARKEYGVGTLVEGHLPAGSRTLLVEDLITDAGSKLRFIEAINETGGILKHVLVLFDRLQGYRLPDKLNIRLQ